MLTKKFLDIPDAYTWEGRKVKNEWTCINSLDVISVKNTPANKTKKRKIIKISLIVSFGDVCECFSQNWEIYIECA